MGLGPITRLISVGSIIADVRLDVPHLPARGGDVLGSAATVTAGGGFNVLAAAARQGLPCLFAGQHGSGPYGDRIRADLAREGIASLLPASAAADSGFCVVLVEPDGERTFITSPGVEASLGARALADIPLQAGDAVFVSGYDLCYPDLGPAIAAWIGALPAGISLVVDPGPLVAEIPAAILDVVLAKAAIWTMNRREAALLGECVTRLARSALLVVRDGAAGATLSGTEGFVTVTIPAPPVVMVDSTGAGDAHTGVLIAALAAGLSPIPAVARANAAAALAVTHKGPATAPTRAALDAFRA